MTKGDGESHRCSFCGRRDIKIVGTGHRVFICAECVIQVYDAEIAPYRTLAAPAAEEGAREEVRRDARLAELERQLVSFDDGRGLRSKRKREYLEEYVLLRLRTLPAQQAALPELPALAANSLEEWLDNGGDERADDAIIKLTDAKGTPIAHVTADWMRRLLYATDGTRFGPCVKCGRPYAEHTYSEMQVCHPDPSTPPAQQAVEES